MIVLILAQYVMLSMYDIIHALNYFIFIKLKKSIITNKRDETQKNNIVVVAKMRELPGLLGWELW